MGKDSAPLLTTTKAFRSEFRGHEFSDARPVEPAEIRFEHCQRRRGRAARPWARTRHLCLRRRRRSDLNFAGTSFLTLDQLNQLKYASSIVNVVADARLDHGQGLGTFAYDDEGVPAQCTDIIKAGKFRGYLSNRETAHLVGLDRSSGTMRTESWNRLPIIRMTNVSLLPGTWDYDDLIANTHDGILMETNRSWSIDDRRYQFQFSTEIGWEIKGGKKVRMLKNPSYSGITTEFWNSCDAICRFNHWTLWGTPNCGKGQPMQTMGTGHGASPARFRNVRIGTAFSNQ